MGEPRYRPRHYTPEPAAFGKAVSLTWFKPSSDWEKDQAVAAWMQHVYATRINAALRSQKTPLAEYATSTGVSYDRLAKVLRGDSVMRFEDVAQAQRLLGGIIGALPTDPFGYDPYDNIFH